MNQSTGSPTNASDRPIAALMTPRGRGAVATVRLDGGCSLLDETDPPLFRPAGGRSVTSRPVNRICYGHWGTAASEDVVVCRTDEESAEIHCHGGEAAVSRILNDLRSAGCEIVSWPEMASRQKGLFETECLRALSEATTLRTATILLRQQSGLLRAALERLLTLSQTPTAETRGELRTQLKELLAWRDFGLHLTRPWRVVLAGRPNVGKSSLVNALLGYSRAIVYDQPGTTRDVVTAETAFDGWPVELADTAGLRREADDLESAGMAQARGRMLDADCRVLLVDTGTPLQPDDRQLLRDWPDALVVAHKCDLPNVCRESLPDKAIPVSSVTGAGVDDLVRHLVDRLVPVVPEPDTAVPVSSRQVELLERAWDAATGNDDRPCREILAECLA